MYPYQRYQQNIMVNKVLMAVGVAFITGLVLGGLLSAFAPSEPAKVTVPAEVNPGSVVLEMEQPGVPEYRYTGESSEKWAGV